MNTSDTRSGVIKSVVMLADTRGYSDRLVQEVDAAAIAHARVLSKRNAPPRGECCEKMRGEVAIDNAIVRDGGVVWIDADANDIEIVYCPFCGSWCGAL